MFGKKTTDAAPKTTVEQSKNGIGHTGHCECGASTPWMTRRSDAQIKIDNHVARSHGQ
ncbi:hypothetical protein OG978_33715 [Streptomyces sp. NBC_01591]|uniref:hypothetical protein n=1 Tax=Streptomyces sp. NBC_01591 TaxID=2975888 RepID=UPI002DDADE17|nr:hypothetical protein [Streptomyces sp. NBC_01591]WSD71920.1 hypothetical protein OG978_33715 [Streptomyces sp. NBC_01591]